MQDHMGLCLPNTSPAMSVFLGYFGKTHLKQNHTLGGGIVIVNQPDEIKAQMNFENDHLETNQTSTLTKLWRIIHLSTPHTLGVFHLA